MKCAIVTLKFKTPLALKIFIVELAKKLNGKQIRYNAFMLKARV